MTLVGGVEREINLHVRPAAPEAFGIGVDQIVAAVRSENQELPMGAIRSAEQERVVQINARLKRPEDFAKCREVCERRFGAIPAIYATAEICRPELLVEGHGARRDAGLQRGRDPVPHPGRTRGRIRRGSVVAGRGNARRPDGVTGLGLVLPPH